jgi:ribosomal protein S18 acetylase RimI-like enzyme
MKIYILKDIEKCAQVDSLLHILAPSMPSVDESRLRALLGEENFLLFVAEDEDGTLAGMLTLTCCQTLARRKYWIEDVVVRPEFRGQGIGRTLVEAAVGHVRETCGQAVIYLTSNPSRQAARALYRSVGFEDYETGVFRITI